MFSTVFKGRVRSSRRNVFKTPQDIATVFNQDARTKKKLQKRSSQSKNKTNKKKTQNTKTEISENKAGFKTNYKIDKTGKNDHNKSEKE